jgi:Sec-independent protein secretion pathway component TatC
MRTLSSLVAIGSLFLTVASLLVLPGVAFALFVFFPLFLLALVGVLAGLEDNNVRQRNPSMDASGWRDGS